MSFVGTSRDGDAWSVALFRLELIQPRTLYVLLQARRGVSVLITAPATSSAVAAQWTQLDSTAGEPWNLPLMLVQAAQPRCTSTGQLPPTSTGLCFDAPTAVFTAVFVGAVQRMNPEERLGGGGAITPLTTRLACRVPLDVRRPRITTEYVISRPWVVSYPGPRRRSPAMYRMRV